MITLIIIILTSIVSYWAFQDTSRIYKYSLNPPQIIKRKEYFRLVTSGFIHSDWGHLIFNMFTLYSFGNFTESILSYYFGNVSSIVYILFYIVAIVLSDLPTLIKNKENYNYYSLGASGAISSVLFFDIMHSPTDKIYLYIIGMPSFVFGILYLIYCVYMAKNGQKGINHDAHFYGAVFGILVAVGLNPHIVSFFFDSVLTYLRLK